MARNLRPADVIARLTAVDGPDLDAVIDVIELTRTHHRNCSVVRNPPPPGTISLRDLADRDLCNHCARLLPNAIIAATNAATWILRSHVTDLRARIATHTEALTSTGTAVPLTLIGSALCSVDTWIACQPAWAREHFALDDVEVEAAALTRLVRKAVDSLETAERRSMLAWLATEGGHPEQDPHLDAIPALLGVRSWDDVTPFDATRRTFAMCRHGFRSHGGTEHPDVDAICEIRTFAGYTRAHVAVNGIPVDLHHLDSDGTLRADLDNEERLEQARTTAATIVTALHDAWTREVRDAAQLPANHAFVLDGLPDHQPGRDVDKVTASVRGVLALTGAVRVEDMWAGITDDATFAWLAASPAARVHDLGTVDTDTIEAATLQVAAAVLDRTGTTTNGPAAIDIARRLTHA